MVAGEQGQHVVDLALRGDGYPIAINDCGDLILGPTNAFWMV